MSRLKKQLLWKYIWEQRYWFALGSVSAVIMNTSVVLPPIFLGKIIDLMRNYKPTAGVQQLYTAFAVYLGSLLLYNVPRIGKRYWLRVMANRMNCRLRSDILSAVFSYPLPKYDQEKIGDIMSRAIGDVQSFCDAVQVTVTEVYDTALMMLSNFVALLVMRPGLTLVASLPIPLAVWLAQWMGPRIFTRATKVREASSVMNQHLQQNVSGVRVLRLLGREEAEGRRFEGLSARLRDTNVWLALLQGGVMPVYSVTASVGVLFVIAWGGMDILNGTWSLGAFTGYLTLFVNMAARTLVGANVINRAYVGAAAWRRIQAKLKAVEGGDAVEMAHDAGVSVAAAAGVRIQACKLAMTFPGKDSPAVSDLTLDIPEGAWVGVTGPVGCGKTALALALAGLYPYAGSLRLNGGELSGFTPAEKVANVAYLGQDAFLFSASIAENISFKDPEEADIAALEQAATWAALSDDLPLFAEGYATTVGESGVRVSGGQKQRIALARALYPRAPVLILDDAFSAVDIATERRMRARLRDASTGATVIMMSHRLASFVYTDFIVVLDKGKVLERGTHEELMAAGGMYSRIFMAQQWMEEHVS